jgi:hypothetical protein
MLGDTLPKSFPLGLPIGPFVLPRQTESQPFDVHHSSRRLRTR